MADQAQAVFKQVETVAAAEKVSLAALVKVTIFVTTFEEVSSLSSALYNIYGENLPASSLVQVASLFSPDVNIEVDAILALR